MAMFHFGYAVHSEKYEGWLYALRGARNAVRGPLTTHQLTLLTTYRVPCSKQTNNLYSPCTSVWIRKNVATEFDLSLIIVVQFCPSASFP